MDSLVITLEGEGTFTQVSNIFIDEYMPYANDRQLKVYLYLLRSLSSSKGASISEIADCFDYSEKEVVRALLYWEKMRLLSISRNAKGEITYVCVLNPSQPKESPSINAPVVLTPPNSAIVPEIPLNTGIIQEEVPQAPVASGVPLKTSIPSDRVASFSRDEQTGEMIFVAERYIGRPLSASDIQTLIYIHDSLGFSTELIDYLLQYCVEREKRSFRYIETVAIRWAEEGITTVRQAQNRIGAYDKSVYDILKSLGRNQAPTPIEVSFIERWRRDYGFDPEIIKVACDKAVLATPTRRLEYAEKILSDWNQRQIRTLDDVKYDEAAFLSNRKQKNRTPQISKARTFTHFPQQDYDFEALERSVREESLSDILLKNQG